MTSGVTFAPDAGPMDEAEIGRTCQEMTKCFDRLMAAHKQFRASGEPQTGSQWKQVSVIESFFSSMVTRLAQYEGTREIVRKSASSDPGNEVAAAVIDHVRRFSFPMHKVGIFERGIAWEKERHAKLAELRQKKLEAEIAPMGSRKPTKWDHVQSVMRRQRLEEEELKRKAELEAERIAAEEARARAELAARAAAETKIIEQARQDDAEIEAAIKQQQLEAARRKAAADRLAREAREAAKREEEKKRQEVLAAFGPKGLEKRGSLPNKMVWRVNSPSNLTGNVAHEYRVKDKVSGSKGVSFVMGKTLDSADDVVQCVLFDQEVFDEHKAAQWWQENEHRFTAQQRKDAAAVAAAAAMHEGKGAAEALAQARGVAQHSAAAQAQPASKRSEEPSMQRAPSVSQMPGELGRAGMKTKAL